MEPLTALVIEDEVMVRKLMIKILSSQAIRVHAFSSPEHYCQVMDKQCLTNCEQQTNCYDMILTDNRMPGMSGLDFLDRLEKAGCQLPPERKAIISGDWLQRERDQAVERNYKVLDKPFDLSDILDWVDEVSQ